MIWLALLALLVVAGLVYAFAQARPRATIQILDSDTDAFRKGQIVSFTTGERIRISKVRSHDGVTSLRIKPL